MNISQDGIELIKQFEGLRLHAYHDSVGVWTIGVGHTRTAVPGMIITEARADELLREDVKQAEDDIKRLVKVPLDQHQFDALVSFVFNLGGTTFANSTLLKKLNARDYLGAASEILRFNKAGGRVLPGLTRRREAERRLFLN